MAEPGLALGLIAGGHHVDPVLMRLLAQLPDGRVFPEIDATKGAGPS